MSSGVTGSFGSVYGNGHRHQASNQHTSLHISLPLHITGIMISQSTQTRVRLQIPCVCFEQGLKESICDHKKAPAGRAVMLHYWS